MAHAWRRLQATEGRVAVRELADELGWSRKQLATRFRQQIGLPPKVMARVLRFQRAVRLLERRNGDRLWEIALDCGYYDQAHFNRDSEPEDQPYGDRNYRVEDLEGHCWMFAQPIAQPDEE